MDPAEHDLEREIDKALRRLPALRAPQSLAPRVMRVVMATSYAPSETVPAGGWRRWPAAWQMLGLVAACSMAIAFGLALAVGAEWLGSLPAARAAAALWQVFVAPIAGPVLAFTAVMGAAGALLAAALKHVAWEGQEISDT